jgi:RNA-binding signal recognition particle 68
MLLLEAEAAWAYAQELKAAMDAAGSVHTNQRRHMLRRLAKSRKAAAELQQVAVETSSDWTAASCDTYAMLAHAHELTEKVGSACPQCACATQAA